MTETHESPRGRAAEKMQKLLAMAQDDMRSGPDGGLALDLFTQWQFLQRVTAEEITQYRDEIRALLELKTDATYAPAAIPLPEPDPYRVEIKEATKNSRGEPVHPQVSVRVTSQNPVQASVECASIYRATLAEVGRADELLELDDQQKEERERKAKHTPEPR